MKKTKAERREDAVKREIERTVERLYSLSAAFLRAETAYEKFREEAAALRGTGKTDDELVEGLPERIARLESDTLIRAGSLMMIHLGLLYALVEGWNKWEFEHPAVDELLKSPFVEELKDYRHAVFHVSEVTDPRIMQWTAQEDRVVWTKLLLAGFRVALLEWHTELAQRLTIKVGKRPL
jgi:hypothetical protein